MNKVNLNWKTVSMLMITIAIIMLIYDNNEKSSIKIGTKVYKILTNNEWISSKENSFILTKLDSIDGFVHLSTANQLAGTLHYYFKDYESLILLQFNSNDLGDKLIFEEPLIKGKRKGKFPHYYEKLDTKKISNFWKIKRGGFSLPEEVFMDQEN